MLRVGSKVKINPDIELSESLDPRFLGQAELLQEAQLEGKLTFISSIGTFPYDVEWKIGEATISWGFLESELIEVEE